MIPPVSNLQRNLTLWVADRHTRFVLSLILATSAAPMFFPLPASGEQTPLNADSVLSPQSREVYQRRVLPFLKANCAECHDATNSKAGFCIDTLGPDFLAGKTATLWREATDKINLGKMPPAKVKKRPDPHESYAITQWANQEMRNAVIRAASTGGRVAMRRMNRAEYANSLRDILHLDEHHTRKFEQELPVDGKVDGFDRGGAALLVDKSTFQAYLDVAREAVAEAMPAKPPALNKLRLDAVKDGTQIIPRFPKKIKFDQVLGFQTIALPVDMRHVMADPKDLQREIDFGPQPTDFVIKRDGGLELSIGEARLEKYPSEQFVKRVISQSGYYRFRIKAGASRGSGKDAIDAVRVLIDYCKGAKNPASCTITIDAPLDQPRVFEQEVYLQSDGPDTFRPLQINWNPNYPFNGYGDDRHPAIAFNKDFWRLYMDVVKYGGAYSKAVFAKAPPEEVEATRKSRDAADHALGQFMANFNGPLTHLKPEIDLNSQPRLWYEYIEMEGPFIEWPTKANGEVFFNGEEESPDYARQIFSRLLPRVYRRPVDSSEVDDMVQQVATLQKLGHPFAEAVRKSIVTLLVSPDFLYIEEPAADGAKPSQLNDYELATRLSYLLWSTMPDAELFKLASERKLSQPDVLGDQVRRMIADPKSRRFVEDFVGQWLRVRDFDSITVESIDNDFRNSAAREPYEFFQTLLRDNLPIINVLDSNFLVIDQRLARQYLIGGVTGDEFRRVELKPQSHRGGIMGMAGILGYLSDGHRPLPVKRGAYLLDVLFNSPPPLPPPDAGDLPIVKDPKTVRERLEGHRNRDTCAACHARIDPYGLALENLDAQGRWREFQQKNGNTGDGRDLRIDVSGALPDGGKAFKDFAGFKSALSEDKQKFLEAFTEKLLAYALGRPIAETDRAMIDRIVARAAKDDYKLQEFLQAIVADPGFRTK